MVPVDPPDTVAGDRSYRGGPIFHFSTRNFGSPFRRKGDEKIYFETMLKTDGTLPAISAFDIGGWALAAFKNADEWIGEQVWGLDGGLSNCGLCRQGHEGCQ